MRAYACVYAGVHVCMRMYIYVCMHLCEFRVCVYDCVCARAYCGTQGCCPVGSLGWGADVCPYAHVSSSSDEDALMCVRCFAEVFGAFKTPRCSRKASARGRVVFLHVLLSRCVCDGASLTWQLLKPHNTTCPHHFVCLCVCFCSCGINAY